MYSLQLMLAPPALAGSAALFTCTIMRDRHQLRKDLFGEVRSQHDESRLTDSVYSRLSATACPQMTFCHPHNLVDPDAVHTERRHGIRVTLPPSDTLRTIIGDDWEQLHWYASEAERDRAYRRMAIRHGFYRNSDTPTQILKKISR